MDETYMNIHFRLYDKDIIKMAEEILNSCSLEFRSKEELCKKIVEKELRRLHAEVFGGDKFDINITQKDITVRLDQCYIFLNIILKLLSALFNIELDKILDNKIDINNILDGLYDDPPARFQKIIKEMTNI